MTVKKRSRFSTFCDAVVRPTTNAGIYRESQISFERWLTPSKQPSDITISRNDIETSASPLQLEKLKFTKVRKNRKKITILIISLV